MGARVSTIAGLAVLGSLCVTALPLVLHLPPWIPALFGLLTGWRAWLLFAKRPLPHRWILYLAVILPVLLLWVSLKTLVGREGGVAFLLLLIGGKVLETQSLRDWRLLLALGFFLAVAPLLFDQGVLSAAWLVLTVFMLTWAMVLLAGEPVRPSPRLAGQALMLSLPLMLVLFVVMPRLPGPLWSMPADPRSASTGLSDSMAPGSIGQMIPSREPVFTAQFRGLAPTPEQLYWRVMAFERFDGERWRAFYQPVATPVEWSPTQPRLDYEMVAEPYQTLLPHLEQLAGAGEGVQALSGQRLQRRDRAQTGKLRYRVQSVGQAAYPAPLSALERAANLRLPPGNPRTVALGQALAQANPQPQSRLQAARRWWQQQALVYTLSPPVLQGEVVDGLLFGSRQGFCEHFSSAFTVLLRAAGLPARVVVGFQGGEFIPQGGFWLVRSSDAHAWTEVWVDGFWQRVDPTALIAPQRVMQGAGALLPAAAPAMPLLGGAQPGWLQWAGRQWQAANFSWQQWVVGYDATRQQSLFRKLGWSGVSVEAVASMLAGGALLAASPWLVWWWRGRQRPPPALRGWQALIRHLRRRGLAARASDTPAELLSLAAGLSAPERQQLADLLAVWQRLVYQQGVVSVQDWRAWRRQLRAFRPVRRGRQGGR